MTDLNGRNYPPLEPGSKEQRELELLIPDIRCKRKDWKRGLSGEFRWRLMVYLFRDRNLTINEIVTLLALPETTVSNYRSQLRRNGILQGTPPGAPPRRYARDRDPGLAPLPKAFAQEAEPEARKNALPDLSDEELLSIFMPK